MACELLGRVEDWWNSRELNGSRIGVPPRPAYFFEPPEFVIFPAMNRRPG
jgi:hypothetical protein